MKGTQCLGSASIFCGLDSSTAQPESERRQKTNQRQEKADAAGPLGRGATKRGLRGIGVDVGITSAEPVSRDATPASIRTSGSPADQAAVQSLTEVPRTLSRIACSRS